MSHGNLFAAKLTQSKSLTKSKQLFAVKNPDSILLQNEGQLNAGFILSTQENKNTEVNEFLIENEEEDDVVSHKRQFAACNYSILTFFTNDIVCHGSDNSFTSVDKVGISADSHLYITIQVFRI